MRTVLLVFTLLATLATGAGPAQAKLRVVATVPDLAALAAEVGGDDAQVTCLASWKLDPHYVDGRPSLMLPLHQAQLLIDNGMELEVGWLPPLVTGARNPRIQPGQPGRLTASDVIAARGVPAGRIDRSMGDVHPQGNPHYVFDPREMAKVARHIGARMGDLLPERAAALRGRAEELAGELERFAATEAARFRALPEEKRRVVQYHRSLSYMFDWLGLTEVAALEPLPGIAPNPAHVAKVLETMRAKKARVVAQETYFPARTAKTVAKLVQGRFIPVAGATRFADGESYLEHIRHITADLYDALAK